MFFKKMVFIVYSLLLMVIGGILQLDCGSSSADGGSGGSGSSTHAATDISFNREGTGFEATNVQNAITEIKGVYGSFKSSSDISGDWTGKIYYDRDGVGKLGASISMTLSSNGNATCSSPAADALPNFTFCSGMTTSLLIGDRILLTRGTDTGASATSALWTIAFISSNKLQLYHSKSDMNIVLDMAK